MPNRKSCYKDLEKYNKTRYLQHKRYYKKTANRYPKKQWSYEEDQAVLCHDIPDSELSAIMHRSVGAIQARRSRLKSLK